MHCCGLLAATEHRQGGSIYIYKPQMYIHIISCDVLHSEPIPCLIHRMYVMLRRMHACTLLTATVDRQHSSLQDTGTTQLDSLTAEKH